MRRFFSWFCLALMLGWPLACAYEEGLGAPHGLTSGQTDTDPSTGPGSPPTPTSGAEGQTAAGTASTGSDEGETTQAASTGPAPSGCGDGIVDPGEACDEGNAANREDGACLPDCTLATCGDGFVQAGKEECDLGVGNSHAYSGCVPVTCLWGQRCGDGIVSPGHELCDPGAPMDPENATVPCTLTLTCRYDGRIVFLSSQTYSGDLGGISGADLKCQALAKGFDPERAHTYRAWLSDGVSEPASTFAKGANFANTPYVLRNGVQVASSFADLVAQGPAVGITLTDTHEVLVHEKVWTHTTHEGKAVPDANHCMQWTSNDLTMKVIVGKNALPEGSPEQQTWADERWWTRYVMRNCFESQRLYCFEN